MKWGFVLMLLISSATQAQHFRLKLIQYYNLSDSVSLKEDPYFGSISGIQYVSQRGKYYMITDGKDEARQSYLYEMDTLFRTQSYNRWKLNGVYSGESIRYHKRDSSFYFTTELDSVYETGGKKKSYGQFLKLSTDSVLTILSDYHRYPNNKGYEASAVDSTGILWGASESPKTADNPYLDVFGYDLAKQDTVLRALYPLDINACGYPDNGVSDMVLATERQMLFVERCWSGEKDQSNYSIHLYTAYLPKIDPAQSRSSHILEKNEVTVDWGGVHLDNIEGITWGPKINGFRTLVLVSDDNYNKFDAKKAPEHWQRSQVLIMQVITD